MANPAPTDALDGILMVPPERAQILGRAVWKARYVVIGRRTASISKDHQNSPSYSQLMSSSRSNFSSSTRSLVHEYCICVYKGRDDMDPVQQYPLSTVSDCQVQNIAHPRKQGPVLPTLVITMADKERKRRSSRAAGLISGAKDAAGASVVFRTPPDDHHISLHEWARFIMSKKSLLSPDSPNSPMFSNPFSPQSRDAAEYFPWPPSAAPNPRGDVRALHHKSSTATYSTGPRERPMTFSSESPSLRSKRSDVSSPSSNANFAQQVNYPAPGQQYTSTVSNDLPSPITPVGEYQGDLIEGWTSAQGRCSTMSSQARGRDSISSQAKQPSIADSSSPPRPRETILDRAFQLRCIPGVENEVPGEEKLSSLARFDALMREADEKRRLREAAQRLQRRAQQTTMRSTFEPDDSSDEEDAAEGDESDDTDSNDDNYAHEQDLRSPPPHMDNSALKALDFIASRHESQRMSRSSRPSISRNQMSYHADMPTPTLTHPPPARPHTAHAKSRPKPTQRVQSNSHLPSAASTQDLPFPLPTDRPQNTNALRPPGDPSQSSSSSAKRLSFTEFTKRLSSTSSLLLVQTNTSGGSSRRSSEVDIQSTSTPRASGLIPRDVGFQATARGEPGQEGKAACGWRGSVGVTSADGGFF